jgi:hypothetical protein
LLRGEVRHMCRRVVCMQVGGVLWEGRHDTDIPTMPPSCYHRCNPPPLRSTPVALLFALFA